MKSRFDFIEARAHAIRLQGLLASGRLSERGREFVRSELSEIRGEIKNSRLALTRRLSVGNASVTAIVQ